MLDTMSEDHPVIRRSRMAIAIAALGTLLLILPEIWSLALATFWALHGLFHLGTVADVLVGAVLVPPAVWATWKTIQLVIEAESGMAE